MAGKKKNRKNKPSQVAPVASEPKQDDAELGEIKLDDVEAHADAEQPSESPFDSISVAVESVDIGGSTDFGDLDGVPSMDYLSKKGYSTKEAQTIIDGITLEINGPGYSPKNEEPAYIVTCPREAGMWRAGMKFSKEASTVLVSSLTTAQCEALENADPRHLKVMKENF